LGVVEHGVIQAAMAALARSLLYHQQVGVVALGEEQIMEDLGVVVVVDQIGTVEPQEMEVVAQVDKAIMADIV
jgi:hypothetical protein